MGMYVYIWVTLVWVIIIFMGYASIYVIQTHRYTHKHTHTCCLANFALWEGSRDALLAMGAVGDVGVFVCVFEGAFDPTIGSVAGAFGMMVVGAVGVMEGAVGMTVT